MLAIFGIDRKPDAGVAWELRLGHLQGDLAAVAHDFPLVWVG
jgi:hypothetical protein